MIKNKQENLRRKKTQYIMGLTLPVILIGGFFYPYIGFPSSIRLRRTRV